MLTVLFVMFVFAPESNSDTEGLTCPYTCIKLDSTAKYSVYEGLYQKMELSYRGLPVYRHSSGKMFLFHSMNNCWSFGPMASDTVTILRGESPYETPDQVRPGSWLERSRVMGRWDTNPNVTVSCYVIFENGADPCAGGACFHDGVCSSSGCLLHNCTCGPGWTGSHCELEHPCNRGPCPDDLTCFLNSSTVIPSHFCAAASERVLPMLDPWIFVIVVLVCTSLATYL